MLIPILIAIIVACTLVVILTFIRGNKKNSKKTEGIVQKKGRNSIVKDVEKKLAHDPHNVDALQTIGELYYSEKNWEKVWSVYKTLYDISSAHIEVNVAAVTLRMGIAAFNMEKYDDAINTLMLSLRKNPDDFDGNYILGKTLYTKGTYDKALFCFKKARALNPENIEVTELLAMTLFKLSKYRDSLPFLKRVLDVHPENKEILFDMAVAMGECQMQDKALKVFMHLRPDPQFGAQSCLEAGKMHEHVKNYKAAVQDYEIALKLENIPEQTLLQIKYRLALSLIALNDISKGLVYLKQIQNTKASYKDVDQLVTRYSELNQNKNLQTYLLSGTSDFVALCRKLLAAFYPDGYVKVEDVQVQSESVEIVCEVDSARFEAKELFRFYRTQTVIGDIYVREFHSKVRDSKCDKGTCITMGSFSESAHKFIEGRPIDLLEKDDLLKILKKISVFG